MGKIKNKGWDVNFLHLNNILTSITKFVLLKT